MNQYIVFDYYYQLLIITNYNCLFFMAKSGS